MAVRIAAAIDLDRRSNRLLRRMRSRYGDGPLVLGIPGRRAMVVLAPRDARRVLAESPEPFTPANREKRGALSHFQPSAVLISTPPVRDDRRRFNEAVLESGRCVHTLAEAFVSKIRDEVAVLSSQVDDTGRPTWSDFETACSRINRRIVLGDQARDDQELTDGAPRGVRART